MCGVGKILTMRRVSPDMPHACKIECVTRSEDKQVLGFRGVDGEGRPWSLSNAELIAAIGQGRMTCFVVVEGQAHLLLVRGSGASRYLDTFVGQLEALPLPLCR